MITRDPRRDRFDGLSDAEIAKKMGCSNKLIHKIRKRAGKKLLLAIQREAEKAGVSVREFLYGDG